MQLLKFIAWGIGGLVLLALVSAVALYILTDGEYEVPPTVTHDPDLPRIEIDGYTFHAETFGDSSKPVVIVLHGGPGGDYRSLLGLQALADEYFVVFYDQRGSGLSERIPDEQLTYQAMLNDLDTFVNRFGNGAPVHLIGHSWGGILASAYLGVAPEKVAKVVMAEPGYLSAQEHREWHAVYSTLMSGPTYFWHAVRAGFEAQHVTGPDADAPQDYLIGVPILHYFTNHPDNPYHCPGKPYDAPMWRWGARAGNVVLASATEAELNAVSAHAGDTATPILFLAGECNTWLGPELQDRYAALYLNARLEVIGDAGHNMFWDNPAVTLAVVRAYLGE